jgi:hypothetical protein
MKIGKKAYRRRRAEIVVLQIDLLTQARWEVSEDGGGTASCVESEGQLGKTWHLNFSVQDS